MTSSSRTPYEHHFSAGHGGWYSNNCDAARIWDGIAHSYSPWFLDANHASPGAGYLHLILWIYTDRRWYQPGSPAFPRLPYRCSSFADQGKSTDLRGAKLTVRLRGEIDLKGSQLMVLAQAKTARTTANMVLHAQPIPLTDQWSDQTVTLADDPSQWTCIGARVGKEDEYGYDEIGTVLADLNVDLIFVLFPLTVKPACPGDDRPGRYGGVDFPPDISALPKGLI